MIKPNNVADLNWTLTYDPKVIQPSIKWALPKSKVEELDPNVHKGNLLDKATFRANTAETGIVYGSFMELSGLKATTTGTVGVIRFRVVGEKGASTPLHLSVKPVHGPSGTNLPMHLLHGSIHVIGKNERPPGTGPSTPLGGGPMALDALVALKMSVNLIPPEPNYDVDRVDGVTARDAVIIAPRRLDQLAKGKK
jgi:hypothetical protein